MLTKFIGFLRLSTVALLAGVIASCSSESTPTDTSNGQGQTQTNSGNEIPASIPFGGTNSSIPIVQRISTQLSDEEFEGWACISDKGQAFVYSFFEQGSIAGFDNTQLGLEILINADTVDSDLATQSKFTWQEQSEDGLLLDIPDQGVKISFNNVRFTENNEMTAYSSLRGQLYCSLQSGSSL